MLLELLNGYEVTHTMTEADLKEANSPKVTVFPSNTRRNRLNPFPLLSHFCYIINKNDIRNFHNSTEQRKRERLWKLWIIWGGRSLEVTLCKIAIDIWIDLQSVLFPCSTVERCVCVCVCVWERERERERALNCDTHSECSRFRLNILVGVDTADS